MNLILLKVQKKFALTILFNLMTKRSFLNTTKTYLKILQLILTLPISELLKMKQKKQNVVNIQMKQSKNMKLNQKIIQKKKLLMNFIKINNQIYLNKKILILINQLTKIQKKNQLMKKKVKIFHLKSKIHVVEKFKKLTQIIQILLFRFMIV